jgi:hypothetical protein
MDGPTDWSSPDDYVEDPDAPTRPLLVASPIAAERKGGKSLARQATLDRRLT